MKEKKDVNFGSWITRPDPAIAEVMAKSGYFSWLTVDIEHSPISINQAEDLIRIIQLSGIEAYVRLSKNDSTLIKRVLDAGADGIIVPSVNTYNDAKKAVDACFYSPRGNRGVGLARVQNYGTKFQEYKKTTMQETKVIVQIEHAEAVENIDEIFSVKGIYGYFIGPYDLSASLGEVGNFTSTKVINALNVVKSAGLKKGIRPGYHVIEPDSKEVIKRKDEGYKIIGVSLDMLFLIRDLDIVFKNLN